MAKDRHGKKKRSPAEKTRDRQKMTSFNRPLTVTVTRHAYFLLRACRGPGAKAAHAAVGAVSCPFWLQWPGRLFSSSKLEIKSWRGSWSALDSWPLISHSLPLSLSHRITVHDPSTQAPAPSSRTVGFRAKNLSLAHRVQGCKAQSLEVSMFQAIETLNPKP